VAFQYIETLEILTELGINVKEISMVGGETKGSLWNQIKADVIGMPVKIPEASDASAALGSAILAGVGSGIYKNVYEGVKKCIRSMEIYNPSALY